MVAILKDRSRLQTPTTTRPVGSRGVCAPRAACHNVGTFDVPSGLPADRTRKKSLADNEGQYGLWMDVGGHGRLQQVLYRADAELVNW